MGNLALITPHMQAAVLSVTRQETKQKPILLETITRDGFPEGGILDMPTTDDIFELPFDQPRLAKDLVRCNLKHKRKFKQNGFV